MARVWLLYRHILDLAALTMDIAGKAWPHKRRHERDRSLKQLLNIQKHARAPDGRANRLCIAPGNWWLVNTRNVLANRRGIGNAELN